MDSWIDALFDWLIGQLSRIKYQIFYLVIELYNKAMLKSVKHSTGQSTVLLTGIALKRPQLLRHMSVVSTQKVRPIEIVNLLSTNVCAFWTFDYKVAIASLALLIVGSQRSSEPDRFPALKWKLIVFCGKSHPSKVSLVFQLGTLLRISVENASCFCTFTWV